MKPLYLLLIATLLHCFALAQEYPERWQQKISYHMDIDMHAEQYQYDGQQKITYTNNSPDTLERVFFHLYFNAFQPGSMMDIRSRTIQDPDARVSNRIYNLKEHETGYQKIKQLTQNGKKVDYEVVGTVLEVDLAEPIMPDAKSTFKMQWEAQVPVQIRRSGRNNMEGIAFSMSQWYPKMAEYDYDGWHADPYVGREFHGVWGSFDVKIKMDSSYLIGATGYLQNPQEVGHGYQDSARPLKRPDSEKLTWHFKADSVHDFVWAADTDYVHKTYSIPESPEIHFIYQPDSLTKHWDKLMPYTARAFAYMNKHFGKYPFNKYSVIQGGDGGMEYPMATLITSHGDFKGLLHVTFHELIHSWYQMVLASNENMYPWMDEGFTVYATNEVRAALLGRDSAHPQSSSYNSYLRMSRLNLTEPMSIHADNYSTNRAYGIAAYPKGAVFLGQLNYILGKDTFKKGMRAYFRKWQFKHPRPIDFKNVMEQTSGIELDWYFQYWINTTRTIDYKIKSVCKQNRKTHIKIGRTGKIPMPLDVMITMNDGTKKIYNIPLRSMRGHKKQENPAIEQVVVKDWPWTYPVYNLKIDEKLKNIQKIEIDPSQRLADINRKDNVYPKIKEYQTGN